MTDFLKKKIVQIGFTLLGQGLESCSYFDSQLKDELKALNNNFSFELKVSPKGPSMFLILKNKRLSYCNIKNDSEPDLEIIIKNLSTAFKMITTQMGTHIVYAQHKIALKGRITESMIVTRMMYRVQELLFPRFLHKNILKKSPAFSLKRLGMQLHIYTLGIIFKR